MIKPAIGAIFGALVVFLLGAFVNVSFDINTWGEFGRFLAAIYMVMAAGIGGIVVAVNE